MRNGIIHRAADRALRVGLRLAPPSRLSESLALWWGYRYRPAPETVRLRSGALIEVSSTEHSQLLLRYLGTFEPHCLAHLHKYAVRNATVLDVGANIGLYTIEAAKAVGPSGKVIAIEAAPDHSRSIERSAKLNDMNNVTVINVAVGDMTGDATLTLPSNGNMGMFTLGRTVGSNSFKVPVRRIDDILAEQNVTSVHFIKMDIEGSELSALRGAIELLRRCHPPILIELNEAALQGCDASSQGVKEFLSSLGYQGWIIKGGGLLPIAYDTPHICDECLFITFPQLPSLAPWAVRR